MQLFSGTFICLSFYIVSILSDLYESRVGYHANNNNLADMLSYVALLNDSNKIRTL